MEEVNEKQRKIELIRQFDKLIRKEIDQLEIPDELREKETRISAGRDQDEIIKSINISGNEYPALLSLWVNNQIRLHEFEHSLGALLLYNDIGPIYPLEESDLSYGSSYHFWTSYGDYWIKACSLLDSVGVYLALVFFGLIDAPLYYNQIIESIALKYAAKGERLVLDGEPYSLSDRESWQLLDQVRKNYQEFRRRRDEIIHVFSPQMYWQYKDNSFDYHMRKILRNPTLDSAKALSACKQSFFTLRLVPLAANDLAASYVGTGSYHRNYYWEE